MLSTGIEIRWMSASVIPTVMPTAGRMNLLWVVDSTTKMSRAVRTISTRIAEPTLNPPGEKSP